VSIDIFFRPIELEMEAARLKQEKLKAEEKATADQIAAVATLKRDVAKLIALDARNREKIADLEHKVSVLITHARGKPSKRQA